MVFILQKIFQQKMCGRFVLVHQKRQSARSLLLAAEAISLAMAKAITSQQTANATGASMAQQEHWCVARTQMGNTNTF